MAVSSDPSIVTGVSLSSSTTVIRNNNTAANVYWENAGGHDDSPVYVIEGLPDDHIYHLFPRGGGWSKVATNNDEWDATKQIACKYGSNVVFSIIAKVEFVDPNGDTTIPSEFQIMAEDTAGEMHQSRLISLDDPSVVSTELEDGFILYTLSVGTRLAVEHVFIRSRVIIHSNIDRFVLSKLDVHRSGRILSEEYRDTGMRGGLMLSGSGYVVANHIELLGHRVGNKINIRSERDGSAGIEVRSENYATLELSGDVNNASGEPGGAGVRLSQDGDLVQGYLSLVQKAGGDGFGGTYTGTLANTLLVGTNADAANHRLALGTNGQVQLLIEDQNFTSPDFIRWLTPHGDIEIGARNTTWGHIYTDRPRFAFNKPLANTLTGSATEPTYTWTSNTNTGMYRSGTDQISFATAGTEVLRLSSTNQLLTVSSDTAAAPGYSWIATTNMGMYRIGATTLGFSVGGAEQVRVTTSLFRSLNPTEIGSGTGRALIQGTGTTGSQSSPTYSWQGRTGEGMYSLGNSIRWAIGGLAQLELTSTGLVGLNGTNADFDRGRFVRTSGSSTNYVQGVYVNGVDGYVWSARDGNIALYLQRNVSDGNVQRFYRNDNICGTISISGAGSGSTTYGTTSDYRLKGNIEPLVNNLPRLMKLRPITFTGADEDPSARRQEGFLAHEVAEIVPQAVAGEKDEVDENGEISPQSLDTSHLVALIVGSMQELVGTVNELSGQVEELQAELAALRS
jgi:hypothetical protein